MHTILQGFLVSGGLIVAIGAQNAFVLKQGLRRWHVLPIILTCFLCDCLLISVGVSVRLSAKAGRLQSRWPSLVHCSSWFMARGHGAVPGVVALRWLWTATARRAVRGRRCY